MRNRYDDKKWINKDTYFHYANTNEEFLTLPVKGIVVEFPGLGGGSCLGGSMDMGSYSTDTAKAFAGKGIVMAYLFPGPWSWGNRGAARMADAVVGALIEKYDLGLDIPLAVCGGSMGGTGALLYAVNSGYEICAVSAACPCIDMLDRYNCSPTFPRTVFSAVACYEEDIEDALEKISPNHLISEMPKTKYFICSDGDDIIFPEEQCDAYVENLKEAGYTVEYHKQPGLKHGEFLLEVREKLFHTLEYAILSQEK